MAEYLWEFQSILHCGSEVRFFLLALETSQAHILVETGSLIDGCSNLLILTHSVENRHLLQRQLVY